MTHDLHKLIEGAESRSVLIIDDDPELCESLARILKSFFHECVSATDGQMGYDLYLTRSKNNHPFSLVLTDLELPKMGGLRLIRQIREDSCSQPILILSAHDEAEYLAEAIRLDVEGYLLKPLSMPKLFESLEKVFSRTSEASNFLPTTDAVTGWKNFQALIDRIQTLEAPPFTLLRIKINHFNNIAALIGETFADDYIAELSQLMQSISPHVGGDWYRIANNEFCLALHGNALEQAQTLAPILISTVRYFHTFDKGIILNSTLSIGIAYGKEDILIHSKLAMEEIRDRIGGGFSVYHQEESDASTSSLESRSILRMISEALHEENIVPFFSPIRHTGDHTLFAFESVAKIRHNETLYDSDTFWNLAVEMAQVGMITRSVIRRTFEEHAQKQTDMPVFINLTGYDLSDDSLLPFIRFCTERFKITPHYIVFQISEGIKSLRNPPLFATAKKLQEEGFKLSLTDFGMGECNLSLLLSLRPDYIRFHPDLITQWLSDPAFASIVTKMVEIVHMINAKVIVPAIEHETTLSCIHNASVDYFSGFLAGEAQESL